MCSGLDPVRASGDTGRGVRGGFTGSDKLTLTTPTTEEEEKKKKPQTKRWGNDEQSKGRRNPPHSLHNSIKLTICYNSATSAIR